MKNVSKILLCGLLLSGCMQTVKADDGVIYFCQGQINGKNEVVQYDTRITNPDSSCKDAAEMAYAMSNGAITLEAAKKQCINDYYSDKKKAEILRAQGKCQTLKAGQAFSF